MLSSFTKRPAECTIVVGMSGGVDSSVTAALLQRSGFNVVGVTLQLSNSEKKVKSCCSDKDIQDAHDVAIHMGFPHYVLDYVDSFKAGVIDNFVEEYAAGFTPSPCVRCNQRIKFGDLLHFAKKVGADAVATGHYAKHILCDNQIMLARPKDIAKDQTYFMAMVNRDVINMIRFPLGPYLKPEVRQIAADLGLAIANKGDSQDLCFIQNGSYRDILKEIGQKAGRGIIVNSDDEVLGYHDGVHNYTVGQRKGIEISNGPWFVIKIIANENKVVVGRQSELLRDSFEVDQVNLMTDHMPDQVLVQVRARHKPVLGSLIGSTVHLHEPTTSIAPGQISAFYDGDTLLGGARILR